MDGGKRLTFVSTFALALFCFLIYALLIASCSGPDGSITTRGPDNSNFSSTLKPDPAVRIKNHLASMRESRNTRQRIGDRLNQVTGELKEYIDAVVRGTKPANPLVGSFLEVRGMDREKFQAAYHGERIRVARWKATETAPRFDGPDALAEAVRSCFAPWTGSSDLRINVRLHNYTVGHNSVDTDMIVEIFGRPDAASGRQATSLWKLKWDTDEFEERVELKKLEIVGQEEIVNYTRGGLLFKECTGSVMKRLEYDQLFYGLDFWALRVPGIDVAGHNGIAVSDINRDGFDDIYVCQPHGLPNLLLTQNADGTVESIGEKAGVNILDDSTSALIVDIDNDRDQDLVVCTDEALLLYSQSSDGKFQLEKRMVIGRGGRSISASDFDQDGDLDLMIARYQPPRSVDDFFARPVNTYESAESGGRNLLLRYDEGWTFKDVTEQVGLGAGNSKYSRAAIWVDYDLDGDQDLYVANDFNRDQLFENNDGWFNDVGASFDGIESGLHSSASAGEFNRDGKPDIFVASALDPLVNQEISAPESSRTPTEKAFTRGCKVWFTTGDEERVSGFTMQLPVYYPDHAYSSVAGDLNNDGTDDLLVTSGMMTRRRNEDVSLAFYRGGVGTRDSTGSDVSFDSIRDSASVVSSLCREGYSYAARNRNKCFLSLGEVGFANFSSCSGFDISDDSRAVATTDWDGDGDLDVIVNSRSGPQLKIFANQLASSSRSVTFELLGRISNRDAIGSRVDVYVENQASPIIKFLNAGSGALSQSGKRLVVGLGDSGKIEKVSITWPNGASQEFTGIQAGKVYRLIEGGAEPAEISNSRHQLLAVQPATAPPPQAPVDELFERAVFYPKAELPRLQFQAERGAYFNIENFENRPVLVLFWTRDTGSERVLTEMAEEVKRYDNLKMDVIGVYLDPDSSSAETDWKNARDSIEETQFPYRWGTAAKSTIQKLELLFGDWFVYQDLAEVPFALLLDSNRRVSVYYPTRRIEFETIRNDLELLEEPLSRYQHLAVPFPGVWTTQQRPRPHWRLSSAFRDRGFKEDAIALEKADSLNLSYQLLQRGLDLQSRDNFVEANGFYREAIKADEGCLPAYLHNGRLLMLSMQRERNPNSRNELLQDARKNFESAINIDPANVDSILALADVFELQGKREEAIEMLKGSLESDPEQYEIFARIGRLLFQQRKYQESARYLVGAYEKRPNIPFVASDLGVLYLQNGSTELAVEMLRSARKRQPSEVDISRYLAEAEFFGGSFERAIELGDEVLKMIDDRKTRNIVAWLLATCTYESSRDGNRALQLIKPMVELFGGSSAFTLEIQAAALAETGAFQQAVQVQQAAVELVQSGNCEENYNRKQLDGMESRLSLYKRNQPYRTSDSSMTPIERSRLRK